ncbi:hypothetical protein INR77_11555 [Erythrobacter sp. SCSIO 43205]|uniref:hypothetical protein n=1 Tax=Erythrobacter sp. SCSIO 43205 TaxID=2779361 RepID=UPI001CA9ABEA|nr:hypothetical protein [Erythrobacter sp. SCSIO 43205]UAB77431.1 hypothetical protein INR77_11555 [Erythrobacter sp. SCSIO 43205]
MPFKIKIKRPKIRLPKVKISKPKLPEVKIPKVKIVHVEADVKGDLKAPGKIVENTFEAAKDGVEAAGEVIGDALEAADDLLTNAKREIDTGLTVLKANTDREAEQFWRNVKTEFNFFFATACGVNSERKKWQRKYDQGEISATELEERTKDLPPDDECAIGGQWSSEEGFVLTDGDGVPSQVEPDYEPQVMEFFEALLTDDDLKLSTITKFMEAAVAYRDRPIWPGQPVNYEISAPFPGAQVRGQDGWGNGAFGASRGRHRRHAGVDFAALPGTLITSPVTGRIDRITDCYSDKERNGDLKAIVIKNLIDSGFETKVLYVKPLPGITVGSSVEAGKTAIGNTQGIQRIYPGITDHTHIQIRDGDRKLVPVTRRGVGAGQP